MLNLGKIRTLLFTNKIFSRKGRHVSSHISDHCPGSILADVGAHFIYRPSSKGHCPGRPMSNALEAGFISFFHLLFSLLSYFR